MRRRPHRPARTCVRDRSHVERFRAVLLAITLITIAPAALATTYRCEVDGHVTYGDQPCTTGKQATVASEPPVDAASRAAAAARLRDDRAAIVRLEREKERERQQDLKAAALAKRRGSDITRNAQVLREARAPRARRARRVRSGRTGRAG